MHVGGQIGGHPVARARDAEARDQVNESARALHRAGQALGAGGRRDEADRGEPTLRYAPLERGVGAGREVGEQQPRGSGGMSVGEEPLDPVREHRIHIGHDDDGDVERRLVDLLEHARRGHALVERRLGGALDRDPVGQGVGERDADLDQVRAGRCDHAHRFDGARGGGIARREIGNERRTSLVVHHAPAGGDRVLRQNSR